jgi:hypothetical protein
MALSRKAALRKEWSFLGRIVGGERARVAATLGDQPVAKPQASANLAP